MSPKLLTFQLREARPREAPLLTLDEGKLLREYQQLILSLDQLLERLFFAYNRYLAAYLQRWSWDEATIEDVLQSAWVILWTDLRRGTFFRRRSTCPSRKPILAFLIKTCENLTRNMKRHAHQFPHLPLEEIPPQCLIESTSKDIRHAEARLNYHHIMQVALRVCTPDERRVLDLLAMGLDRCEVAEIVGRKPHWVDNRRRAACRKIRTELHRLGGMKSSW